MSTPIFGSERIRRTRGTRREYNPAPVGRNLARAGSDARRSRNILRAMSRATQLLRRLWSAASPRPEEPRFTARYQGPDWPYRRRRVLERLDVDLVIDVGANQGQYGADLRRGGYGGPIASIEPSAQPFARLQALTETDRSWSIHRLALGAQPGTAKLNVAANEGKSSSLLAKKDLRFGTTETMRYVDTEIVEVQTLESAAPTVAGDAGRILLKLDVQGVELDVIRGAGGFLRRVVAIEVELALLPLYEEQPEWRVVVDALEDLGFTLFAVDPGYSDWDSGRLVEMDALFVRHALAEIGGPASASPAPR